MVLKGAETVADSRGKTSPCCVPGSHKFSSLEQMPLLSYCRDATLCFLRNFGVFFPAVERWQPRKGDVVGKGD